jgi:hypothetical protein
MTLSARLERLESRAPAPPADPSPTERLLAALSFSDKKTLILVNEQLALYRGGEPAPLRSAVQVAAQIFDPVTGTPLPFESWYDRKTGARMTAAEKMSLSLAAWRPLDPPIDAFRDEVLRLLPRSLRDRVEEALTEG